MTEDKTLPADPPFFCEASKRYYEERQAAVDFDISRVERRLIAMGAEHEVHDSYRMPSAAELLRDSDRLSPSERQKLKALKFHELYGGMRTGRLFAHPPAMQELPGNAFIEAMQKLSGAGLGCSRAVKEFTFTIDEGNFVRPPKYIPDDTPHVGERRVNAKALAKRRAKNKRSRKARLKWHTQTDRNGWTTHNGNAR